MTPITLLTMIRSACSSTQEDCQRCEFTPEAIYRRHNAKIENIASLVGKVQNGKERAKLIREVNKVKLAPMKVKSYSVIAESVRDGVNSLTSVIILMKK